ncbi:MAG TPA: hydroxymethylbilane synthase [Alphaproteobacteria bacterium]|nr:hydroxymethylbilane synthase [Alphaproteobacteria bacterium]
MAKAAKVKIGTRGSPLALAQAEQVRSKLVAARPELSAPGAVEIVTIRTSGDRIQDRALADAGGKGLFTKEIDEALIAGTIDIAVHSMKDVPTVLPAGLVIPCVLAREDPRDVLIVRGGLARAVRRFADLPHGATLGTSSLRRAAQALARRPDLKIVNLRGNVDTRLRRLDQGKADATLLALAGLRRLGLVEATRGIVIETDEMLPAVGQGAIGVQTRAKDKRIAELVAAIHHRATGFAVAAERAVLERLDGSCRTPIAALAVTRTFGRLRLDALVARPDGGKTLRTAREGAEVDAEAMGHDAGEELAREAGPNFFSVA